MAFVSRYSFGAGEAIGCNPPDQGGREERLWIVSGERAAVDEKRYAISRTIVCVNAFTRARKHAGVFEVNFSVYVIWLLDTLDNGMPCVQLRYEHELVKKLPFIIPINITPNSFFTTRPPTLYSVLLRNKE